MYGCDASHKPDLPREEIIQTYHKAKRKLQKKNNLESKYYLKGNFYK